MPAYAYRIIVKKQKQRVNDNKTFIIEGDSLTLDALREAGIAEGETFSISETTHNSGIESYSEGYEINVQRTRLETKEERDTRVAKEESYMAEYNRRKALKGIQ